MQKHNWILLIIAAALMAVCLSCKNDTPSRSYEETLDEFLKVSGTGFKDNPLLDKIPGVLGMPGFKNDAFDFQSIVDSMETRLKPLYKEYYTQQQLEELIQFFNSDIGQHYVEVNQKMSVEGMKASQEVTMDLIKNVTGRMMERSSVGSDGDEE